jgi:hypothetical protein
MFKSKTFLSYSLLISFTLICLYLAFPEIIYSYFVPEVQVDDENILFLDWKVIISSLECQAMGIDVYNANPCDPISRKYNYGRILLFIPYIAEYKNFYNFYFPLFVNFVFVCVIAVHFKTKSLTQILLFFLVIFNPSTLLLMERLNFDIIVFLFIFLLCYFRSNLLNFLVILFLTLAKFYPISLLSLFFFDHNKKSSRKFITLALVLVFLVIVIFFVFIDNEKYLALFSTTDQFSASPQYSFYFLSFLKLKLVQDYFFYFFFNYLNIPAPHTNLILFVFSAFLLSIFLFFLLKVNKIKNLKAFNINSYEHRLFFLGGGVLVSIYFAFNNIFYREVFLICLIPYLIEQSHANKFFKFLVYYLFFHYIFFIISYYCSAYQRMDGLFAIKQLLDAIFYLCITAILCVVYFRFTKNFFIRKVNV